MTLLVAGTVGRKIWMVADTAITGGGVDLRSRICRIKIVPSHDGRALIGYAGDEYYGARLIEAAARMPAGAPAAEFLVESQHQHPSADFAYAYIDESGPHLIRVHESVAEEVPSLFLGLLDAFEHLQRIRHDSEIDPTPEAIRTFVCGSGSVEPVPDQLSKAVTSMLKLFAERSERDVGGWPVPYFVTTEGTFFCGYGYAVSDPILKRIGPGALVPHGTAEAGGFGLSVTEFGRGHGMVVYWLQLPGGTVFVRGENGYDAREFRGAPSEFKQQVLGALGKPVELLFGDQPTGPAQSIAVMLDEAGIPSIAIAKHKGSFSVAVLNVATPFRVGGEMSLIGTEAEIPGAQLSTDQMTVKLSDDKNYVTLGLLYKGKLANKITIQADELSLMIPKLAEARAVMSAPISREPPQNCTELAAIDPIWRTNPPLHPDVDGVLLRLRHPGFGWLTFILPHHEAAAMGKWLCDYENNRVADPPGQE